ncbi:hypothetical protein [Tepidibacter mesophilus]|uniref:hypothetical protein n=1 Tax=Tepidibacter mesophilus TaxID=655607 RepID=UPI000C07FDA0|nr:hypothetical protein [Tepidibacter mesophilus]
MIRDIYTGIPCWEIEEEYAKRIKSFVSESLVTYKLSSEELEKYRNMKIEKEPKPSMLGMMSMRRKKIKVGA